MNFSRETPDVTTKPTSYDLTNMLVRTIRRVATGRSGGRGERILTLVDFRMETGVPGPLGKSSDLESCDPNGL